MNDVLNANLVNDVLNVITYELDAQVGRGFLLADILFVVVNLFLCLARLEEVNVLYALVRCREEKSASCIADSRHLGSSPIAARSALTASAGLLASA